MTAYQFAMMVQSLECVYLNMLNTTKAVTVPFKRIHRFYKLSEKKEVGRKLAVISPNILCLYVRSLKDRLVQQGTG